MKPTRFSLAAAAAIGLGLATTQAAVITRDNSADNLNLNTAWTGDVLPGQGDIATWDASSTLANALAAAQTWGGLDTSGASGAVTITPTANLVLDNTTDASTILNVGANNFTWNGNNTFNMNGAAGSTSSTSVGATFAGSSIVTIGGTGTKNWSTNATTNGMTNVTFTGTLVLRGAAIPTVGTASGNWLAFGGGGGAASDNGTLTQTGSFALDTGDATSCGSFILTQAWSGQYLKLNSLSGTGSIRSDWGVSAGTQTRGIELDQATDTVLSGSILVHNGSSQRRNINFVKKGVGTLTLTGGLGSAQAAGGNPSSLNFDIQAGTLQWGNGTTNVTYVNPANWDAASTFVIGSAGTFRVAASGAFNFNRKITGGAGTFEVSSGTVTVSADNTAFVGTSKVGTGATVKAGIATAFGGSTVQLNGGTLDVNGYNLSLSSLTDGASTGVALNNGATAATLTIGSGNGDMTLASVIQDGTSTLALAKTGTGTLALTGDNTYSGGTTILGGTIMGGKTAVFGPTTSNLTFNGADATLKLSATVNNSPRNYVMTQTGTIDTNGFNLTHVGAISGAGGLNKTGAGILRLQGTNTYAGTTTINAGTLEVDSNDAISDIGGVVLADAAGAMFKLGVNHSETIGSLSGGGAQGGNVDLQGLTLTLGANNASTTFGGQWLGSAGSQLIKTGTGTLTLSNTATNDNFTGEVLINDGAISIAAVESLGKRGTTRHLHLNTGGTLQTTADMSFNTRLFYLGNADVNGVAGVFDVATDTTTGIVNVVNDDHAGATTPGALKKIGGGTLLLSGINTFTGGSLVTGGTLMLNTGSASALGSGNVSVKNGGTLDLNGNVVGNNVSLLDTGIASGAIVNSGATAVGVNNLALGYTGTVDTNGQLITVAGNLTGSGTITGNVSVLGNLAVGNSPGLITITGDTLLSSTGISTFEIGGTGTRGVNYDALDVGGTLTLDGSVVVTSYLFDPTTLVAGDSFDLMNWGTLVATSFNVGTDLDLSAMTLGAGLTWNTSQFLVDGTISVAAVPEPSSFACVMGLAVLGALCARRRRRS